MYMNILDGAPEGRDAGVICALSWTCPPNIGYAHPAGTVQVGMAPDAGLIFALSTAPLAAAVASEAITWPKGPAFMRVDEVCFPVGAIAHRHTHSGAGFRHLVRGQLRLETDNGSHTVSKGGTWFEAAMSPVRAVALQSEGVTSFVRCMVVAPSFEGRSTFQLVDPEDAQLPRLQLTHRHIDHLFYVDAG